MGSCSPVLGAAIASVLTISCVTTPSGSRTTGDLELDRLVTSKGFRALAVPRDDYRPGTILSGDDLAEAKVVALAEKLIPGIDGEVDSAAAAWLSNWHRTRTVDTGVGLLGLITPEDGSSVEIGASLRSKGATSYRVRFGEALIEVLPLEVVRKRWGSMEDDYQARLRDGYPVIVEALSVGKLRYRFFDERDQGITIGVETLNEIFELGASASLEEKTDGTVFVDERVIIGIKLHDFSGENWVRSSETSAIEAPSRWVDKGSALAELRFDERDGQIVWGTFRSGDRSYAFTGKLTGRSLVLELSRPDGRHTSQLQLGDRTLSGEVAGRWFEFTRDDAARAGSRTEEAES